MPYIEMQKIKLKMNITPYTHRKFSIKVLRTVASAISIMC